MVSQGFHLKTSSWRLGVFMKRDLCHIIGSVQWIYVLFLTICIFQMAVSAGNAAGNPLTIIHSNDLHSHLLGFSPNADYTPESTGDDNTVGGWARLATVIRQTREKRSHPVLLVDAGDFTIGSLFHLPCREKAYELRLMKQMGYDVISLGNHEFDPRPEGLSRMLTAAGRFGKMPALVLANAVFSEESPKDDALAGQFKNGLVKPYHVTVTGGLRIGVFGLMGKAAAEVAPFASPVKFSDPIAKAAEMVALLRGKEHVDVVVCLSHSGLRKNPKKSEDEILAAEVDGIDIIVSGHTHTTLETPKKIGKTLIVQAGSYGQRLGVMDLMVNSGGVSMDQYQLVSINDSIPADKKISEAISSFEREIEQTELAPLDLEFRQAVAHTAFPLKKVDAESNLGNLIADAIRWAINVADSDPKDPESTVVLGVVSNGVIRDHILVGKTGDIALCDAFRAVSLGIGSDGAMGYPLVSFYLYASEIKKAFEVLTTIYPMKGSNYFLQFSGMRVAYNPNRILFERVTDIQIGDEETGFEPLDCSVSNKRLYRVGADIYNSTFLKIIGRFTHGILNIVPKDRNGQPVIRPENRTGGQRPKQGRHSGT